MLALVIDAAKATPQIRTVDAPTPPRAGVVIQVMATGLCRSDWHAWAGHDSDVTFPHVPGHELAGTIAAIGEGVTQWHIGDRVTVPFVCGCGTCEWCLRGDAQVCPNQEQPGFTYWGSFAEYVAVHAAETNLVAIPDGVSFEAAASLGCRFATAFRALEARARLQPGEWVTVVGAGGVGLSAVMIAKALGAQVIAVDRNPQALEVASALGADHVLLSGTTDIPEAVMQLTDGGSHVSMDAVGSESTCADAILSLRRRGRHVQVGLLLPDDGQPRVPMWPVIGRELDVLGSHGMAAVNYPRMLELIRSGALDPQQLVERTISLAEAASLLPRFDSAVVAGMTLINPRL